MKESEYLVLAGIVPDVLSRVETAILHGMSEDNFKDRYTSLLWRYVSSYYDDHLAVIPGWVVKAKAEKAGLDSATILTLTELYDGLSSVNVQEHEFKEALKQLKDGELAEKTSEVFTVGREILLEGIYDDRTGSTKLGQEAAREYVSEALQELEVAGSEAAPEGDMRDDMNSVWRTYLDKESNPEESGGISHGIPDIDEVTGGVRPGELVLLAGFTGCGKSHLVVNIARNTMLAKKNVLMITTETTREEMEIRILARHSKDPKFRCPEGLDSHEIMSGILSDEHKKVFKDVVDDFKSRDTGHLFMVQMPSSGSVEYVYSKANQYNRKAPIDLIVIDSINLLRLPRRYDSKREMLEDMLQGFKRFASAFDNGRGVAVVSPWQMSRTAWKESSDSGGVYTLASLSDTAEAERCLPLDAPVLTPRGWVTIGSLEVGDVISSTDGETQTVEDIHDYENKEIYELVVDGKFTVETSPGHIWTVKKGGKFVDVTTEELHKSSQKKWELPPIEPVKYDTDWHHHQHEHLSVPFMAASLANLNPEPGQLVVPVRDPGTVTDYIGAIPLYGIVDERNMDFMNLHFNAVDLADDPIIASLMEACLFSGDQHQFQLPEYYIGLPSFLRLEFLNTYASVCFRTEVDFSREEDRKKYLRLLPYGHKGHGQELLEMVLGLGLSPLGDVRHITKVKKTRRKKDVRCITVSDSSGLFITSDYIPTHNSASQIITLFKEGDGNGNTKLSMQVLKNRSGRELGKVTYPVDYRNSYIDTTTTASSGSQQSLSRKGMNFKDLMYE